MDHVKEGLWFFIELVKFIKLINPGELMCVVFLLLCVVNLRDDVMNNDFATYLGLGIYVTKCNMGLGFLWKLDVVLGSYGLKRLRGEGRLRGSREREIRVI